MGGLEELDDEIKAEHARTGKGDATLVPLDLTDMQGIDRLGGAIHERWGKLDILVANAGVLGVIAPIGHVEAKTFEKVMAVNVTGTWRLIRSVDPLLRLSDAGRAVIVSSNAAHSRAPSGRPTPLPRPRSRRWRVHGPTRQGTCRCASMPSTRAHPHRHAGAGRAGRKSGHAAASFRNRREALAADQHRTSPRPA